MELIIPDFSFIEAGGHEKINVLKGRNVVFHCTSMSVYLEWEDGNLLKDEFCLD